MASDDVILTSNFDEALEADGLVVPGVGAFAACMKGLNAVKGTEIIRKRKELERPTLGICIGMQILFLEGLEHSDNGSHAGVGIWEGQVTKVDAPILPHMGWNTVESASSSILFKGIENESFYFVHSYAVKSAPVPVVTWSTYGEKFVSAIEDEYVSATQFHPEKSGRAGLALIKNWVKSL